MVTLKKILAIITSLFIVPSLGASIPQLPRDVTDATRLDHPTVQPPLTDMDEYLLPQLSVFRYTIDDPFGNWAAQHCVDKFKSEGYDVHEIDMFGVHYEDVCLLFWP